MNYLYRNQVKYLDVMLIFVLVLSQIWIGSAQVALTLTSPLSDEASLQAAGQCQKCLVNVVVCLK